MLKGLKNQRCFHMELKKNAHQLLKLFNLVHVCSVVSNSLQPHRLWPARLLCPWDSPGKNTGVCCRFLRQFMKVKIESQVAQSCPTLCNPTDCSLPGSSIHEIFQARVLEWGAIAFSISNIYCVPNNNNYYFSTLFLTVPLVHICNSLKLFIWSQCVQITSVLLQWKYTSPHFLSLLSLNPY